jgi:Sec7-like guanine-nucleotide exchange factor
MDTIFSLAFTFILLNTDLHIPNLKPEKQMKERY